MITEILIILFLIFLNGLFAASEIALVSSRRTRLEIFLKKGNKAAGKALKLHNSPNTFLSTVQIGITLIGILTGLYSGAAFAPYLKGFLEEAGLSPAYSDSIATGLVVVVITFLSLVFGELVPKRVGLVIPEKFAMAVAYPMTFLARIASPFVWLLGSSTDLIMRLFNVRSSKSRVSEEEIKALVEEGVDAGVVAEIEHEIVDRVFNLGDKKVLNLMTYRSEIVWLNIHDAPETHRQIILESNHNIYPVCDGEIDNILGVVSVKMLLNQYLNRQHLHLKELLTPTAFIHETATAYHALKQFRQSKIHHAFVIDEYGALQGMVTMKDLLNSLVGDISEDEPIGSEKVLREDGSWLIDGQYPLSDFADEFDIELSGQESRGINTLAGLIILQLSHLPVTGEKLAWKHLEFEIIDMDGRRIDKILVRETDQGETEPEMAE